MTYSATRKGRKILRLRNGSAQQGREGDKDSREFHSDGFNGRVYLNQVLRWSYMGAVSV